MKNPQHPQNPFLQKINQEIKTNQIMKKMYKTLAPPLRKKQKYEIEFLEQLD